MEIIVADANVFVYLLLCKLLNKFLSTEAYQVKISTAVYYEITSKNKRISREYPELRELILNCVNNRSSTRLELINTSQCVSNIFALKIYYELSESGELDLGEIESIPLAIELEARFLSNDADAIEIANDIIEGLGVEFLSFCEEMHAKKIINPHELISIKKLLLEN